MNDHVKNNPVFKFGKKLGEYKTFEVWEWNGYGYVVAPQSLIDMGCNVPMLGGGAAGILEAYFPLINMIIDNFNTPKTTGGPNPQPVNTPKWYPPEVIPVKELPICPTCGRVIPSEEPVK